MGKRGPAPKPTQLRLLHGDRESRVNRDEPIAPNRLPLCPEGASDEVREIWDYTIRELVAMKVATSADRDTLHVYCEAVISHRKACAVLAKSPLLLKGAKGNLVRNPMLQVQRDAAQSIRSFAQEFGLTPSARSTIKANEARADTDANPFADFATG